MKLKINIKNKIYIYSDQKFEDQISYNQQIMTFLNFSQLPESVFPPNFSGKPSQIFLLLKSIFHWPTFLMANKHKKVWKVISRKTNTAKGKTFSWKPNHIFYWLKLTRKYFPYYNFSVFRWPESVFRWPTFLMTNKHRKVWKMVS